MRSSGKERRPSAADSGRKQNDKNVMGEEAVMGKVDVEATNSLNRQFESLTLNLSQYQSDETLQRPMLAEVN